ncbi:hypothetical protein ACIHFE_28085 [Streptomyces sp. NPDC052396]|uniref:hypothetical protein n=1 Tax=Streptomyces sp. NPDC052396 TaxID=3365689 RepID=UPI0037D6EE3B
MSLPAHPRAAITLPTALLGSALLLTGGVGMAFADGTPAKQPKSATAQPARAGGAAGAAAAWAASRLNADSRTLRDPDLTADLVMGLAAAGTQDKAVKSATDDLAKHAGDYLSQGVKGQISTANTAKLALAAAAGHGDLKNFGGQDLEATLRDRMQKDSGRFTDLAKEDHSDRISQALAVLALQHTTGKAPVKAVDFLAGSACKDGGFPLALTGTSADNCASDPEATALTVQALEAARKGEQAKDALKWLTGRQHRDGGFATARGEVNARSTALGVQALNAGGRTAEAAKGLAWLRGVQVDCTGDGADRGAVGWNKPEVNDKTLRATAQVIPALAGKSVGQVDGGAVARPAEARTGCGEDDATPGTTDDTVIRPSKPATAPQPSSPATTPGTADPTSTGSPAPTGTATAEPTATATEGTNGATDGTNGTNGTDDSLASTGSAAYPAALAAGALLITGSAAVALSRRRGHRGDR